MAACYMGELSYVKPPANEVVKGLFVPKLKGNGATGDAIALLGALIMPYVAFKSVCIDTFFYLFKLTNELSL